MKERIELLEGELQEEKEFAKKVHEGIEKLEVRKNNLLNKLNEVRDELKAKEGEINRFVHYTVEQNELLQTASSIIKENVKIIETVGNQELTTKITDEYLVFSQKIDEIAEKYAELQKYHVDKYQKRDEAFKFRMLHDSLRKIIERRSGV